MFVNPLVSIRLAFANVIFVTIITWNGIYVCVSSSYIVSAFKDVSEIFNGLWSGLYYLCKASHLVQKICLVKIKSDRNGTTLDFQNKNVGLIAISVSCLKSWILN